MYIDSHVHCRDFEESHKETIGHALRVAEDSGLSAIFDMPNTRPATTIRELVLRRLELTEETDSPVFYGLYIGVTSNPSQIREAVRLHGECFPASHNRAGVIGLKMFAGKSVGDLGIVDEETQRLVYRTLAQEGYKGVLAVHCEKESLMRSDLWNPEEPITHSYARPDNSEYESVRDQIRFASSTGYLGHLHICHVSIPESVDFINANRKSIKISCGVTPHHLLLDNSAMMQRNGILYKVNPPLRLPDAREELFERFANGKIDILESDHAPHTFDEKTGRVLDAKGSPQFMSGIPNLASWPDVFDLLTGKGVEEELLEDVAFFNVKEIFGVNIQRLHGKFMRGAHIREYAFDPYADLK